MNARIEVLGCSAGAPGDLGAASGYLITVGDRSVLLDCGPGVVQRLAERRLLDTIDAVVLSHQHFDHCGDLMALAYRRAFPRPGAPLTIHAPAAVAGTLQQLDQVFGIPSLPELATPMATQLPLREIEIGDSVEVCGIRIDTHPCSHPVPTMAVRLPELGFSYTADSKLTDGLIDFCSGTTILSEATWPTAEGHDFEAHGHMSGADAGRLAHRGDAAALVLTHFADPADADTTVTNARAEYAGALTRAVPGMLLPLSAGAAG